MDTDTINTHVGNFRIGDKVRIVDNVGPAKYDNLLGMIGVITSIYPTFTLPLVTDIDIGEGPMCFTYFEVELEP